MQGSRTMGCTTLWWRENKDVHHGGLMTERCDRDANPSPCVTSARKVILGRSVTADPGAVHGRRLVSYPTLSYRPVVTVIFPSLGNGQRIEHVMSDLGCEQFVIIYRGGGQSA